MKTKLTIFFSLFLICFGVAQNILDYYPKTFKPPLVFDRNSIRFLYDSTFSIRLDEVLSSFVNYEKEPQIIYNDSIAKFYPLFRVESDETFGLFSYLKIRSIFENKEFIFYTVFKKGKNPYVISNYSLYSDDIYPDIFYWYSDSQIIRYIFDDSINLKIIEKQRMELQENLEIPNIGNITGINKINEFTDFIYSSFIEIQTPLTFNTNFFNTNFLFFQIQDSIFKDRLLIWKKIDSKKVQNFILNPMFYFTIENIKCYFYVIKWGEYNLFGLFTLKNNEIDKIIDICVDKNSCHFITIKNREIIVEEEHHKVVKTISL